MRLWSKVARYHTVVIKAHHVPSALDCGIRQLAIIHNVSSDLQTRRSVTLSLSVHRQTATTSTTKDVPEEQNSLVRSVYTSKQCGGWWWLVAETIKLAFGSMRQAGIVATCVQL